jgi:hypothetical protein
MVKFWSLKTFFTEYKDIFDVNSIDTGDARPIRQPSKRLPQAKQVQVQVSEMLDDMQRLGAIEESNNPWPSPVVLFRKKNVEIHF